MANLITNPTFTSGTSGWTARNATLAVVQYGAINACQITNTGTNNGNAYQDFTTAIGTTYIVRLASVAGTGVGTQGTIGTPANETLYQNSPAAALPDWSYWVTSFTATTTTTRLVLYNNSASPVAGTTMYFGNVSVDAGAVWYTSTLAPYPYALSARNLPWWMNASVEAMALVDTSGTLSGTVSMTGSMFGVKISVFDKTSHQMVAGARPAADGTFTLTGLDRTNLLRYYAICEVPGSYNATIFDKLVVP